MKLIDLNRQGGIGANSLFVQLGGLNILIDCGLNPKLAGREATPDLSPLRGVRLDLIIITHCHLDHIGSLPLAMRDHPQTPVVMSLASHLLIERMLHNSANVMLKQKAEADIPDYPLFTHEELDRLSHRLSPIPYGQPKRLRVNKDELTIILHPAGHVAGAAAVEIHHKHRQVFFTGDVLFENLRTLDGATFPAGHFDTIVMETTRGTTERAIGRSRIEEVARLITAINDTIQRGGSVLIPVFALGRMQELVAIMNDARKFGRMVECPIFGSGLGLDLCDYFDTISKKAKQVHFNRGMLKDLKLKPLPRGYQPGRLPAEGALYLVSSGMLVEKTPSYNLAATMAGDARNTIAFVGYCDPDTAGGELLRTKPGESFLFKTADIRVKLKARVERFELSGHADRDELLQFAVQATPRAVILTHGDPAARAWFVEQLTAKLPQSRIIDPVPLQVYDV